MCTTRCHEFASKYAYRGVLVGHTRTDRPPNGGGSDLTTRIRAPPGGKLQTCKSVNTCHVLPIAHMSNSSLSASANATSKAACHPRGGDLGQHSVVICHGFASNDASRGVLVGRTRTNRPLGVAGTAEAEPSRSPGAKQNVHVLQPSPFVAHGTHVETFSCRPT